MSSNPVIANTTLQPGDNVVLVAGSNVGTSGVFLRLTDDVNWAEIEENNKQGFTQRVRNHPVIWLQRASS